MDIIVARYNENIEWTKEFSNIIIYNKGEKLPCGYNEIVLENVGREGHTYYKYIYDNYDNLKEYTVFLQGNPFDHSHNIINNLRKYNENLKILEENLKICEENLKISEENLQIYNQNLKRYNQNLKRYNQKLNIDFKFLSDKILTTYLDGCPYHYGLTLRNVYELLFNEKREENINIEFGCGAQFIVSKNQILKRPKNFYLQIVKLLEYDINPIEGYVIERLHKIIFT